MKKTATILLKFIASFAILFLVLRNKSILKIYITLKSLNICLYFAGLLLAVFFAFLNSFRLYYLIENILKKRKKIKLSYVLKVNFIGHFYNLVLPSIVGGDFIKGLYLGKVVTKKAGVALCFIDRAAGLGGMLFCAFFGLGLLAIKRLFLPLPFFVFLAIFSIILSLLLGLVFLSGPITNFIMKFKYLKILWFLDKIDFSKKKLFLKLACYSFFFQFFNVITSVVAFRSCGIKIDPIYFFLFTPFLSLVILLPITIAGIGLREVTALWLYRDLKISESQILAATTVIFSYLFFLGVIGGIVYVLRVPSRVAGRGCKN